MTTPLHLSDIHGLSRLGVDGVRGVTDLVEDVHHAVLRIPGIRSVAPDSRTGGITGFVYRSIHGVTGVVGSGLDLAFTRVAPQLTAFLQPPKPSPSREQFIAVLNGVLGDHLAATENPLAIKNALRKAGRPVAVDRESLTEAWPEAGTRLLVTAHGLCMHDGYWRLDDKDRTGGERGLPESLAAAYDYSTVDFHYNTGRHISDSGKDFAELMDRLAAEWPADVEELVILGHSMGGLVARSAVHYGLEAGHSWPSLLKKIVFLGTPHHGSPVERAGNGIDRVLGITRYSAPFARVGKIRSAGITDLRHGNIIEADWRDHDRFEHAHDTRSPTRLPDHVECFAVAATLDEHPDSARSQRFGDGLVPVPSALGRHRDPAFELPLAIGSRFVATETGHLNLLRCPVVSKQVHDWLA